ncbi:hypothetical protein Loa_01178 [Legionella oakridgensis ATCC 33761 = DSM 21215]|uniref:Uncharacterized protein n=1 Tax=Legionella oakridgensis ATCC 33761 = DSM 21215 TaxID=1268635 RepID=W0B861_9GAMM|nr:hypothetical protein Loa_01178 [Legionella oakridgensis ATCC 33761 = DSM 21215]STY19865.1 Uncharacterised protein [Legionella longbeachae]
MIFIVCQRVILIYFRAKPEMVARLRGHDRFFCHVQRFYKKKEDDTLSFAKDNVSWVLIATGKGA